MMVYIWKLAGAYIFEKNPGLREEYYSINPELVHGYKGTGYYKIISVKFYKMSYTTSSSVYSVLNCTPCIEKIWIQYSHGS